MSLYVYNIFMDNFAADFNKYINTLLLYHSYNILYYIIKLIIIVFITEKNIFSSQV